MVVGIPCSLAAGCHVPLILVSHLLMASGEEWMGYVVVVFAEVYVQ